MDQVPYLRVGRVAPEDQWSIQTPAPLARVVVGDIGVAVQAAGAVRVPVVVLQYT